MVFLKVFFFLKKIDNLKNPQITKKHAKLPQLGASNEYPQHKFLGELRKMCTLIVLIWSYGHGSDHYALCKKKTWTYIVTGKNFHIFIFHFIA